MLVIRLLGPLDVVASGHPVQVPGARTRAVLARLALDAGSVVTVDRLIEDVWGADTPSNALNALQVRISQLRLVLGREHVRAQRPGYLLDVDPADVDALAVEVAIADARQVIDHDPNRAAMLIGQALVAWRGEPFSDLGDAPFTLAAGARSEELRLGAFEDLIRLDLDAGRTLERLPELEELASRHPLREPLHELLVRSYGSLGRQADALRAYGRIRDRLVDELGIDPGPGLRALETSVLRQDPSVVGQGRPTGRGDRTDTDDHQTATSTGNLPRPLAALLHRSADIDAVLGLLERNRLVTVTGPAGVGKTRLAIEVARRAAPRSHGTWFIDLEGTTRPDQVVVTLAATIGASLEQPTSSLRSRLRLADMLLVIDNCEHLDDGPAVVLRDLLEHCPSITALATSQRPVGVPGETLWPLEPLTRHDAVDLFVVRVQEMNPRVAFDPDTMDAVDQICAALDHLPLAIELAARRCGVLGVDEVAQRLRDRFHFLSDRGSGRPQRHQTLANAIGWSYDLLFPDTQLLLQIVAAFPDGARLDAIEDVAESVGMTRHEIVDLLAQLVDRSLVSRDVIARSPRYRVLNSIRAFALDQAVDDQRFDRIRRAHAGWVAKLSHQCFVGLRTDRQALSLVTLRDERASIDVAFEWLVRHDPESALAVANDLYLGSLILGDSSTAASRLERALDAAGEVPRQLQARVRSRQSVLLARIGRHAEAMPLAVWSLEAIAGASALEVAHTRSIAGQVHVLAGRVDEGLLLMKTARGELAALGDTWAEAISVFNMALAAGRTGDHDTQERLTHEAIDLLRPHNDPFVSRLAHRNLALLELRQGDLAGALASFERSIAAERAIGFAGEEAITLRHLARVRRLLGERDEAIRALMKSKAIGLQIGDASTVDLALADLIAVLRSNGDAGGARQLLDRHHPHRSPAYVRRMPVALQVQVGALAVDLGDDDGRTLVKQAFEQLADYSDLHLRVLALDLLGRTDPDPTAAAGWRTKSDRLAELAGVHPGERPDR